MMSMELYTLDSQNSDRGTLNMLRHTKLIF